MKKYFLMGIITVCLLLGIAQVASAYIIENVELNFASGGEWLGTITFNDDYMGMIAADGYLTGGTYNYNDHFTWTWWQVTAPQVNPYDYNLDGYYEDWLMNGTSVSNYNNFIGLTWDVPTSILNKNVYFILSNDPYVSGDSYYSDVLVDYSASPVSSAVPEPTSMILFATGLAGAAFRKKFIVV